MQSSSASVFNLRTFPERTTKYQTKQGYRSIQNTDMGHLTLIAPLNKNPNAQTQNTDSIDFDFRSTVLITAGGTFLLPFCWSPLDFKFDQEYSKLEEKAAINLKSQLKMETFMPKFKSSTTVCAEHIEFIYCLI